LSDLAIDTIGFVDMHSVSSSRLLLFRHKAGTKFANGERKQGKTKSVAGGLACSCPAFFRLLCGPLRGLAAAEEGPIRDTRICLEMSVARFEGFAGRMRQFETF
jgi:hypothetical protein